MRLKEAHLPDLFCAHSRSCNVCDGAGRELQASVCSIDFVSQYRNTNRVQFGYSNILADQPLHNVQIMDHQVKYYVNIQRTRGKLADAMNLKIDRIAHM